MKEKYNFYDIEINQPNGEPIYLNGTPNNNTKETNLKLAKSILKNGKFSGRIINQEDKAEQYLFSNGEEINFYRPVYTKEEIEKIGALIDKVEDKGTRQAIKNIFAYILGQIEGLNKTLIEKGLK